MLLISTPLHISIFLLLTSVTSTEENPENSGKDRNWQLLWRIPSRYRLSHFGKGFMCFRKQHENRDPQSSGGGGWGHMSAEKVSMSPLRHRKDEWQSVMADSLTWGRLHYQWLHSFLAKTVVPELTPSRVMRLKYTSHINTGLLLLLGPIATH